MAKVRLYVATSIDGFIADSDGGVDWLEPYHGSKYGYKDFAAEIGAIVIGRRTYEQITTFGEAWPYADKRTIIVTSKQLKVLPQGAVAVDGVAQAIAHAQKIGPGDTWILGGAVTMRTAFDANLVDVVEIFVVPVMLGGGLSLLGALHRIRTLELEGIETYADGVVKLRYSTRRRNAPKA